MEREGESFRFGVAHLSPDFERQSPSRRIRKKTEVGIGGVSRASTVSGIKRGPGKSAEGCLSRIKLSLLNSSDGSLWYGRFKRTWPRNPYQVGRSVSLATRALEIYFSRASLADPCERLEYRRPRKIFFPRYQGRSFPRERLNIPLYDEL